MHPPRPPAFGQGTAAFLWAAALGGFIFIGMVSLSISMTTSIVTTILCAAIIFGAVRTFGADAPRHRQKPR